MTSVGSPLPLNTNGYTVLLGYHEDLKVFVGFDLDSHRTFTEGSPSIQLNISLTHDALQNGFGFTTKDNLEVVVGVRPDQLLTYVLNAEGLHPLGADALTIGLLKTATETLDVPTADIGALTAERRLIVSTVVRRSRDVNFSRRVLSAYDHRCAVTRAQLRLVDAAHILPVPSEESSDHTSNGIALSPTMHRAFDQSLIYLDEDRRMKINAEKVAELSSERLSAGLRELRGQLTRRIHLPDDQSQRPNLDFVRKANKLRRIPGCF